VLDEFKKHINDQFPNLVSRPFLLACSGGIDSVVLVHLCSEIGLDFSVAHCNFRLRGTASDVDEKFVRELAKKLKIGYYVTHFDTIGYVNKNKVSLQVAARDLRYRWFAEVMTENGIRMLVTAHHADDNLETFLINLSRGTGIDGLTGIPEKTDTIARPLLQFSREQIHEYALSNNIKWREDASNMDAKYLRNKIRQDIVPILKELNSTFLSNFQKTQCYLTQTAEINKNHIKGLRKSLFERKEGIIRIAIARLNEFKPNEAYIYQLLRGYGFTEWEDVNNLLTTSSGKEVRSATHRLVKDRKHLLLTEIRPYDKSQYQIEKGQSEVAQPVKLSIEEVTALNSKERDILYADKKSLKYPLTIRKWQKGDYFYPLGMNGKKMLSKFFKDEKMDILAKERQWLLCSADEIVWVIGKRADNRFRVSDRTEAIIRIKLN